MGVVYVSVINKGFLRLSFNVRYLPRQRNLHQPAAVFCVAMETVVTRSLSFQNKHASSSFIIHMWCPLGISIGYLWLLIHPVIVFLNPPNEFVVSTRCLSSNKGGRKSRIPLATL